MRYLITKSINHIITEYFKAKNNVVSYIALNRLNAYFKTSKRKIIRFITILSIIIGAIFFGLFLFAVPYVSGDNAYRTKLSDYTHNSDMYEMHDCFISL